MAPGGVPPFMRQGFLKCAANQESCSYYEHHIDIGPISFVQISLEPRPTEQFKMEVRSRDESRYSQLLTGTWKKRYGTYVLTADGQITHPQKLSPEPLEKAATIVLKPPFSEALDEEQIMHMTTYVEYDSFDTSPGPCLFSVTDRGSLEKDCMLLSYVSENNLVERMDNMTI